MQITVFFIAYTKKSTTLSLLVLHKEIENTFSPSTNYLFRESGLQITLRLLSSSLGTQFFCIRYFLNTKHKSAKKKILDNVFQSNCSSHAKLLTNLRKIEKRPKIRHRLFLHSALQLCHVCYTNVLNLEFPLMCNWPS